MILKKKKIDYGIIVDCKEANVLDTPEKGSPLVCQLKAGDKIKIVSKPNKYYYGVSVSNSVTGFVSREFVKVE